jgi:hypothetical protein
MFDVTVEVEGHHPRDTRLKELALRADVTPPPSDGYEKLAPSASGELATAAFSSWPAAR